MSIAAQQQKSDKSSKVQRTAMSIAAQQQKSDKSSKVQRTAISIAAQQQKKREPRSEPSSQTIKLCIHF